MDPTYKGFSVPTPTKTRSGGLNLRMPLLIGGSVLVVIVIAGLIANFLTPNTTTISQRLLYRVDALNTLTQSAEDDISDDSIAKINTDLNIVMTGDYAALSKVIVAAKATKELSAIKTEEADAVTTTKLKTAKSNGQYNTTYKDVLLQKIQAAYALADEVQSKTSRNSVKSELTTLKEHLNTYYTELKNLQ